MYGSVETPSGDASIKALSINKKKTSIVFISLVAIGLFVISSMSGGQSFLRSNSPSAYAESNSVGTLSGLSKEVRKKLAAHPTHTSTFSTQTSQINPGEQSNVAEYPVTLTQTKDRSFPILSDDSLRWHFSVDVLVDDDSSPALLAHVGKERSKYSDWIVMAQQPDSASWKTLNAVHTTNDFGVGFYLYDTENLKIKQGTWKVYLSAIPSFEVDDSTNSLNADRIFVANKKSPISLHTVLINNNRIVGGTAQIQAFFIDANAYHPDVFPETKDNVKVVNAFATVNFPDGSSMEYKMEDEDEDGIYSLNLGLTQTGIHKVLVSLRGNSVPQNIQLKRTQNLDITVISSDCYMQLLEHALAQVSESHQDYLEILFGASEGSVDDTSICGSQKEYLNDVHLHAELWAEDKNGDMQPVSWISGMVIPEELSDEEGQWLSLAVHKQWFGQIGAKQGGKMELRQVEILDRRYHIPVSKKDVIRITVRSSMDYPELNEEIDSMMKGDDLKNNFKSDLYVEMVHGPKPSEEVFLPKKLSTTSLTLFLSHGYCTDSSTWPIDEFTDAYLYDDGYNEGVSNDRFARQLLQYSIEYGTKNEFSYIGHSQGGLAGLQLYTYYWSGLDWKSEGSGRKIQSMSSPYRGSSLMLSSLIDLVDEIFGYGCGAVDDISVTGAHYWLTTIPTDRRSVVYYYNVWGGEEDCEWYEVWCDGIEQCDWLSAMLLKDKNDGVCNGDLSNLPGATGDSGNPTSYYCHCASMEHTPAYLWTANNEIMDAKAARP